MLGWPEAPSKHGEAVDPVEHPAVQAHRLQQQHVRVAAGGKLRGGLGQRILLGERERKRVVDLDQSAEPDQPGDRAAVDVQVKPSAVQLPHPPAVALEHQLGCHPLGGRVHQRAGAVADL
jgi:hypothetical protein